MKFKNFTHEMVSEILRHLADNEKFSSLKETSAIKNTDVKELFYDMAQQLDDMAKETPVMRKSQLHRGELSNTTQEVISSLSPNEENMLFKSFRIAGE